MALRAILAEGSIVLVTMTIAAGERSGSIQAARVAKHAVVLDLFLPMEADEREPSVDVVIERLGALATLDVTVGTGLVMVLALMGVAMLMAAGAGPRTI